MTEPKAKKCQACEGKGKIVFTVEGFLTAEGILKRFKDDCHKCHGEGWVKV